MRSDLMTIQELLSLWPKLPGVVFPVFSFEFYEQNLANDVNPGILEANVCRGASQTFFFLFGCSCDMLWGNYFMLGMFEREWAFCRDRWFVSFKLKSSRLPESILLFQPSTVPCPNPSVLLCDSSWRLQNGQCLTRTIHDVANIFSHGS